jgi:hypothetical protein
MTIAFYNEFPDMTTEKAERVLEELKLNGRSPKGQILHAEGPLATGGTWVFDMWESEAALFTFVEQSLSPIMSKLGITPPQPKLVPGRVLVTPQQLQHF